MTPIYTKNDVNIYKITDNIYFRQVDYRKTLQCNSVYLVSKDTVGVIDIPDEKGAKALQEEAWELFGREITFVFLTHPHGDHINGLPYFLDRSKTVFSSRSLYHSLPEEVKNSGASFVAVDHTLNLFLADLELELILPPGVMHCPGEMFIRVKKDGIIAVGDSANSEFREFFCYHGNLKNWIYGLEHYFEPCDKLFLPGHGIPYESKELRSIRNNILLAVKAAAELRASLTPIETEALSRPLLLQKIRAFLSSGSEDAIRIAEICKGQEESILEMVFWKSLHE